MRLACDSILTTGELSLDELSFDKRSIDNGLANCLSKNCRSTKSLLTCVFMLGFVQFLLVNGLAMIRAANSSSGSN